MHVRTAVAAFAALALAGCAGEAFTSASDTGDRPVESIDEDGQTLVLYNGRMVPACSVKYSRCTGTRAYEQCSWSVQDPGTEDWFQGSCSSGSTCEQQGIEARCVGGDSEEEPGSISCDEMSDDHIRVTVTGPITGTDGLTNDPPRPYKLLYGADIDGESNGWVVPYPSGTVRDSVSCDGGEGSWTLDLEPEVDEFNLYLSDRTQSGDYWFDLLNGGWDVSGDCKIVTVNGDTVLQRKSTTTTTSQDPGTIMCKRTSTKLVVTVRGPVLSRLVGTVTSPSSIQYGSNVPGPAVWSVSKLGTNGRATASWVSDTATYTLNLPRDASEFNLYVKGSTTSGDGWFDLLPKNGVYDWEVGGDCSLDGSLIYQD